MYEGTQKVCNYLYIIVKCIVIPELLWTNEAMLETFDVIWLIVLVVMFIQILKMHFLSTP